MQEGKPRQECYTPEVLKQIEKDKWGFAAPGGESQMQLEDRMVCVHRVWTQPMVVMQWPPCVRQQYATHTYKHMQQH